jgi:hypothetical protein
MESPQKYEYPDPTPSVEEKKDLITFEDLWENFCQQLTVARENLQKKQSEIDEEISSLTRIDLTEYNDMKIMVTKLEAAVETLDLVRTKVCGEKSLIEIV